MGVKAALIFFLAATLQAQTVFPPKFVTSNNDPRLTVAELVASAEGTKPFTFQWQRNGINILGATTDTLRITDPKETGSFRCVIANSAGSITTDVVKFANTYVADAPAILVTRKHPKP